MEPPALLCGLAVRWEDVSQALHSSIAFEILALLQMVTTLIISVIFWAVFLMSPWPLLVGFGGNSVGRIVTATTVNRNKMVISISDYCAASGSTPQRILMSLCTIFSMLSISAALFCEDRLKMWALLLGPDQQPFLQEKARVLWMFIIGQLGMFFTGNMEVRDGPRYFQTFFAAMHTGGAIGFVTLAPISAWWFNDSQYDAFFWMLMGSSGCFSVFSVVSLFTDVYGFPGKPEWMTRIYTQARLRPGSHNIEIQVKGLKGLPLDTDLLAEEITAGDGTLVAPGATASPLGIPRPLTVDPVFHQMWLNETVSTGPYPTDPIFVRMAVRQTEPPPRRFGWSCFFVSMEFFAMLCASTSSTMLTFSFARLNYLTNLPQGGQTAHCAATTWEGAPRA
eukprot:EG_transcript_13839